jgi:hypothetical protein
MTSDRTGEARSLLNELRELEAHLEANEMDANRAAWGADVLRRTEAALVSLSGEPPQFWKHAIQECNEAHQALDRLGAPKTRTVRRVRGEGDQEITIGLRDRILSIPSKLSAGEPPAAGWQAQAECVNPVSQVYFRAGLLVCREYMARFVEAQDPNIAMSIRANWWPRLGPDPGAPRQLRFDEVTSGEFGTPAFRCIGSGELSPTVEALPIALAFLDDQLPPLPRAEPAGEEPK